MKVTGKCMRWNLPKKLGMEIGARKELEKNWKQPRKELGL